MAEKEYIEREAILKDYQTICNGVECVRCHIRDKGHCKFEAYIRSIPAADVRPVVKATWIVKEMQALFLGMDEHPVFACSECGYQIYDLLDNVKERHRFCSNCGADMRGTNDEEA